MVLCYNEYFFRICGACNENIPNHWVIGLDKFWHQDCFCCGLCTRVVDAKETFYEKDGEHTLKNEGEYFHLPSLT